MFTLSHKMGQRDWSLKGKAHMYMCHEMPLITTFDSKLSVAEQSKVLFSQRVMSPISKLLEVAWESEREVSARCPSAASLPVLADILDLQ